MTAFEQFTGETGLIGSTEDIDTATAFLAGAGHGDLVRWVEFGPWQVVARWAGSTLDMPKTYDGSLDMSVLRSRGEIRWLREEARAVPLVSAKEKARELIDKALLGLLPPRFAADRDH